MKTLKLLALLTLATITLGCTPQQQAQAQVHYPHANRTNETLEVWVGDITIGAQNTRIRLAKNRWGTSISAFDVYGNEIPFQNVTVGEIVDAWCWDTNGNQVAEAHEDLNGDGLLDSYDCSPNKFEYRFIDGTANVVLTITFSGNYASGTFQSTTYGIVTPTNGTVSLTSMRGMGR